jgi:hypothetical protein
VTRDSDQTAFMTEVQGWDAGLFRSGFTTPEQLRAQITRRLHEWQVATMAGPVDEQDLLRRALALVPEEQRGFYRAGRSLVLTLAAGPRQQILRPSDMERPRPALAQQADQLVDDLVTLLRREWQG